MQIEPHIKESQERKQNPISSITAFKKKLIVFSLLLLTLVCIVAFIFVKGYRSATDRYEEIIRELEEEVDRLSDPVLIYDEGSSEIDLSVIRSEIKSIGELATIEYLYTDAGKFEDPAELFGRDLPFKITTKYFIAKWDGVIKAGINLDQIKVEENKLTKEIIVYIPAAEILSHEIIQDSIETLDEKDGLFNPLKIEDIRKFDAGSMQAMEKRAIENGLLDKAFNNAKSIIERLVFTDAVQRAKYTITIKLLEN